MSLLQEEVFVEEFVAEVDDLPAYYLEDHPLEEYEPQEFTGESIATSPSLPSLNTDAAPVARVPEAILKFLGFFHRKFLEKNIYEMFTLYENSFHKLSDKFYAKESWPPADSISGIVNSDPVFLALYKELYYRHLHVRLQPTDGQRVDSFFQYSNLFSLLLVSEVQLPNQWIWDILSEYIYQFQSYQFLLNKQKARGDESALDSMLSENVWDCKTVMKTLQRFIEKSNIQSHVAHLHGEMTQEPHAEHGEPLLKALGYFSLISSLRVQVLMGDFQTALTLVKDIDLTKRGMYPRVISCHVATFYYVGVCYLMTQRYLNAIKTFSNILLVIARTKQFHARVHQFDHISKKSDQMYALLAICVSVWPYKLEESIQMTLREKFGDQMNRIHAGEARTVTEDLFRYGCPKFIFPRQSGLQHYFAMLYEDLKLQLSLLNMRSYLQLYKSIDTTKLAGYLCISVEDTKSLLATYKLQNASRSDGPPHGASSLDHPTPSSVMLGLDFYMKDDIVHVVDNKTPRRFADYFLRHIQKLRELSNALRKPPKLLT